jgi:hypothetical protein
LSDATIRNRAKRRVAETGQHLLPHGCLKPRPGCRAKLTSRGRPKLNPLTQADLPTPRVMPDPSGQRDLNLGPATLGVNQSGLGLAVMLPRHVAVAQCTTARVRPEVSRC